MYQSDYIILKSGRNVLLKSYLSKNLLGLKE